MCAIVVYGTITVEAWTVDTNKGRETCLYNDTGGACNFGMAVGFIAVVASIGFIMGEYVIEHTNLIVRRKEYFLMDCVFSSLWAFLYFLCFLILKHQWGKVEEKDLPENAGIGSAKVAIFFSFLSFIFWAICFYYAYVRLQAIKAEQAYAAEGGLGISKFPDNNAAVMLGVTPTTPSVPVPGTAPPVVTGLQTFNVAY
ncbi:Synaptogyrin-1 [Orchesella cincta]|uniref:Synaptogyrin-1 n=1 Tax=Orchesella cincta TaxID=48709 RepID=A0A1D2NH89_ORCCI|nr:Synaptogyrin-1 [Orchesella cincta]